MGIKVKKVLISDSNYRIAQVLKEKFIEAGYEVETTGTAKDALISVMLSEPDAIIANFTLDGINGNDFLEMIKDIPDREDMPVLFLTQTIEEKITKKHDRIIDTIKKPFTFDELLTAVEKIIKSGAEKRKIGKRPSSISAGSITKKGFSPVDIIQVMVGSKKSCIIELKTKTASGKIFLVNGNITNAVITNQPGETRNAEEIFYELCKWRKVSFVISDNTDINEEPAITKNVHDLINEGLSRLEEDENN